MLIAGLAAVALSGCLHTSGGVASSSKPLSPGGYKILGPEVAGTDSYYALFGIIPLTFRGNRTHAALNDALGQVSGTDALIQVSADTHSEFWILWSSRTTTVRGTPVSTTGGN